MDLESEIQTSNGKDPQTCSEAKKHSKTSYTREFLLSLSELDVSKKLPNGFDQSILSEFEGATQSSHDRQRIPGSLGAHGFRQSDYGSSPPTRGDSGSLSRSNNGRWDSHSSGHSDRDSDSLSDKDSDTGRRYGNQSRQSWQSSEHDGLLGSGSLARPSTYAAGNSAMKFRTNDHYQHNRSDEPYHPPRPYKAIPHSRRETTDSLNDETFGSTECTSEDREEEERKRRASFELMRKEQQKALQEKQKLNVNKQQSDSFSNMFGLLNDAKEKHGALYESTQLEVSATVPIPDDDSARSSFPQQTATSRPLVPPGFKNTVSDTSFGLKPLSSSSLVETGNSESGENLHIDAVQHSILSCFKEKFQEVVPSSGQKVEEKSRSGEIVNSSLDVSREKLSIEAKQKRTSNLSESKEAFDIPESIALSSQALKQKVTGGTNQSHSTLALEKIFASALTVTAADSTGSVEYHENKLDGIWSPGTVRSSKFAQWFQEEDSDGKQTVDFSTERPNDLFSLIAGGDRGKLQDSVRRAADHLPVEISSQNLELNDKFMPETVLSSNPTKKLNKQDTVRAIITCEDLEQTMLSEHSEKNTVVQLPSQSCSPTETKSEYHGEPVDDLASQHLLSLLHNGSIGKSMALKPQTELDFRDGAHTINPVNNKEEEHADIIQTSGGPLTLETLFGISFMKELQSAEAPVSAQRGLLGVAETDNSAPVNGLLPSIFDESEANGAKHKNHILVSNGVQQTRHNISKNLLGFDDPHVEVNSSRNPESKNYGFDVVQPQLSEDEALLNVGDPGNPRSSMFLSAGNFSRSEFLSSNSPAHLINKLSARNSAIKDERSLLGSDRASSLPGPYDQMDANVAYHSIHSHESSPQLRSLQMNHARPIFHPLDAHPSEMNTQMKFMGPEAMIHYDAPADHLVHTTVPQSPPHHANSSVSSFDHPVHHTMLQQMQMSGSFPRRPPPEFLGAAPFPPHNGNQAGIMQELNSVHGFPFGPRQLNIRGLAMPDFSRSNEASHPEALQRLFEMELRSDSRQIHPFASGHNQGMYSHNLDPGLRYR